MPIRQLPSDVAAKIAAGEVVERPASVVKELLENALDAGARYIRVELTNGGLTLLRVSDDGRGIPADELPLAFLRHATSKISALGDLERIATLGFRGEALASIGAVASVTLLSRPRDANMGAQLTINEGAEGQVTPAGAPAGTSVTVRDLFASVPARLKFLKTRATETGHALHLVEQYALAYPEVRFTALSEGRQVFTTPGDGRLLSVLVAVYGLSVAEQMLALPETESPPGGFQPDDPPRVSGYVSRPTCYKSTRQYLSFFVNRRWVQSRTLGYAAEEAYHSLLLTGRHPIAVINVELDPSLLDVNIHPAKTEIKFLRERQVYAAVQRAVRATILANTETPEVSPNAFTVPAWATATTFPLMPSPSSDTPDEDAAVLGQMDSDDRSSSWPKPGQALLWPAGAPTGPVTNPTTHADAPSPSPMPLPSGFALPGAAGADAMVGGQKLPVLRVLGQVSQSYIITEGPDGMYLVDQHAAHERILLERMIAAWRSREVAAQLLLTPLPLELSPAEREALEDHLDRLRGIGFEIEPFGGDALLVRALPAPLAAKARAQDLRALLLELAGADAEAASHGETWEEHALANVACKAAIKAGQTLSPDEQRELIRQLEHADAYQSCCHGRPTIVHMSFSSLERQFDRR
ncbi:MAG: DNA mismatch repair protein MutL [Ktedonobacterales bacterium]|nr:MAG: DNA mismatch repair protein MutL [Ktedonobacterales bacterium]